MDENDRKIITEAVREGVREGIAGAPRPKYDSSGSSSPPKGTTGGDFGEAVLGGLAKGAGAVASGFSATNKVLGENVENFQQLSRTGASFNNNAMGMRDSIGQTRLSMDEYKQVMDKLSPSIAGLGGTVDQGTKNFNKFSGEFMGTNFAEQLTKMGYTTKDLNDVMAANMANRRFTDLSDEMQRRKAIESTAALAREMDETAKLTGISRQEQMADMKQRSENGKVQAAIQLEVMKGGKDVEQNYNNMQTSLNGLGKGVKDLADEMFTGGVRTEEGAAKMAALGPAGIELQKAVEASKTAKTKEEKDAAEAQLARAKNAVNERMKSEEFLNAVMVAGGKVGPAMQKMYEENKLKSGTTFTENKTGQTTGQAAATNQTAAVNQQQGRDETGAKDAGAKTTELYIQTVNRAKDAQTIWNTELNKLNDTLVRSVDGTRILNRGLDATRNQRTPAVPFVDEGIGGLKDRLKMATGVGEGTPATPPRPARPGEERNNQPNTGPFNNSPNPIGTALDRLGGLFSDTNPGVVRSPASATPATPGQPFADGSKEVLGDWFGKNFGTKGTPALLHGKEAIVPEAKVGEFMQDMMQKANISNFKPTDKPEENKTSMTMEEMDTMMKSMKSMNPESLLQFASKGNEQQAEMAKKIYGEMDLAAKQASSEAKLQKTESAKTTATPKDNPITELQKKLVDAGAKIKVDGQMGPETMSAIKANMANMVKETAKKPETSTPTPPAADTSSKSNEKSAIPGGDATLSDVVKSLETLNMLMGQLNSHAAETAENSGSAVKATKGLNGNLFAR